MQFLFLSMGTLYYFQKFREVKKIGFLLATAVFCTLAIMTRTAGVVLLLALLATLVADNWGRFRQKKAPLLIGGVIVVAGLVVLFAQPKVIRYLDYFFRPLANDPANFFYKNITRHFRDWAELFINIPYSKINLGIIPLSIYLLAGVVTMVYVVRRLFSIKFPIPLHARFYLVGYILLIFNWPFYEARFWFPIVPLVFAVILIPKPAPNFTFTYWKSFLKVYYAAVGLFVLSYYTFLSHNKTNMAERHDAGIWKDEYRIHFFNEQPADSVYNKKALYLLDKYD